MSGRANGRFWACCLVLVAGVWGPYAAAQPVAGTQPAVGTQPPDPAGVLAPAGGAAANAQPGLQAVLLEVQNQLGKIDQRLKAVEGQLAACLLTGAYWNQLAIYLLSTRRAA